MNTTTTDFEEKEGWGYYTAIDLKNCNHEFIRSSDKIKEFIDKLCLHIKMKKFGNPQIVNFGDDENVSGYSMTQLIETSLISGHFVNKTNSAFIDIFSCKKYNPKDAADFSKIFFQAESYVINTILRK